MPKVSVIIPVYGVEKYIERCVRSLFEQTLDDIEYIFVDDCCLDRSIEILDNVIKEYPNRITDIKIVHHKENKGLAQARQSGIKVATGEYFVHCDSDDWVDTDLFEKAYNTAKANGLDVVVYNGESTDGIKGEKIKSEYYTTIDKCINAMMHRRMWWSLCNKMFKRTVYCNEIISPSDNMGEDMCLTLQLMTYCKNIGYIDANYYYYKNPTSIMKDVGVEKQKASYGQICRNISKVRNFYKQKDLSEKYEKGLNYLEYNASFILYTVLNDAVCRKMWSDNIRRSAFKVFSDSHAVVKERVRAICLILKTYFNKK